MKKKLFWWFGVLTAWVVSALLFSVATSQVQEFYSTSSSRVSHIFFSSFHKQFFVKLILVQEVPAFRDFRIRDPRSSCSWWDYYGPEYLENIFSRSLIKTIHHGKIYSYTKRTAFGTGYLAKLVFWTILSFKNWKVNIVCLSFLWWVVFIKEPEKIFFKYSGPTVPQAFLIFPCLRLTLCFANVQHKIKQNSYKVHLWTP